MEDVHGKDKIPGKSEAHAQCSSRGVMEVDGGEGVNRWLQGCYFDADSLMDRGRVLREKAASGEI